jgi:pilus assembly protein CpaC
VLGGSRINLKLLSEVSELSQSGSPFTALNGAIAILPSMTSRRVDTSVQLNDGQSFAVAGLIRNNLTETIKRFPGLGDIPVLGALFRSTEFQKDQTELVFIITPRLVRPMVAKAVLPTSNHNEATRGEAQLMGKSEGAAAQVPQ